MGVKIVDAWGQNYSNGNLVPVAEKDSKDGAYPVPVNIVQGSCESDIRKGLALLQKSREVCVHRFSKETRTWSSDCGYVYERADVKSLNRPCWCGRKIKVSK